MNNEHINILLFIVVSHIFVAIFSVYIGMQIGKLLNFNSNTDTKIGNKKTNKEKIVSEIKIDDAKVVLDINTNNLTKKFDSLGTTKTSSENIASSINKLKNMKG